MSLSDVATVLRGKDPAVVKLALREGAPRAVRCGVQLGPLLDIAAVLRGNHPYLALLNLFWQSEIGRMRWVIVWFPTCEKWSEPRMSL